VVGARGKLGARAEGEREAEAEVEAEAEGEGEAEGKGEAEGVPLTEADPSISRLEHEREGWRGPDRLSVLHFGQERSCDAPPCSKCEGGVVGGRTDPSSGISSKGGVGVGPLSCVLSKGGVVGGRKAFKGPLARNTRGRVVLGKQTPPSHTSSEGGVVVVSGNMGDERGQGFDAPLR